MSWINTENQKPLCYQEGIWDGKKSDEVLCEDFFGNRYLAICYEGTMDGSYFFDWYDKNDFLISKNIRRWIKIPE